MKTVMMKKSLSLRGLGLQASGKDEVGRRQSSVFVPLLARFGCRIQAQVASVNVGQTCPIEGLGFPT